jgi:hypothetical protein
VSGRILRTAFNGCNYFSTRAVSSCCVQSTCKHAACKDQQQSGSCPQHARVRLVAHTLLTHTD